MWQPEFGGVHGANLAVKSNELLASSIVACQLEVEHTNPVLSAYSKPGSLRKKAASHYFSKQTILAHHTASWTACIRFST